MLITQLILYLETPFFVPFRLFYSCRNLFLSKLNIKDIFYIPARKDTNFSCPRNKIFRKDFYLESDTYKTCDKNPVKKSLKASLKNNRHPK